MNTETHLETEVLRAALAGGGLAPEYQVLILEHFSASCGECWRRLEALGKEVASGASDLPKPEPKTDLVSSALCRLLMTSPKLKGGKERLDRLEPRHRRAVNSARNQPWGFARLILEEARTLELWESPPPEVEPSEDAHDLLNRSSLDRRLSASRVRDLEAVSLAYRADIQRRAPAHLEAESLASAAEEAFAFGAGDGEVRAVVAESRALLLS